MDPTGVFLRAEVSLVIFEALLFAILADASLDALVDVLNMVWLIICWSLYVNGGKRAILLLRFIRGLLVECMKLSCEAA
jgi:hypothetical protein